MSRSEWCNPGKINRPVPKGYTGPEEKVSCPFCGREVSPISIDDRGWGRSQSYTLPRHKKIESGD